MKMAVITGGFVEKYDTAVWFKQHNGITLFMHKRRMF